MAAAMKPLPGRRFEAYVSEFIGTFFFVLTLGINVLQKTALGPISIGLTLMAMIFSTGKISGGHFNPAVTFAVWISSPRQPPIDVAFYIVSQLLGGLVAAATYKAILGATFTFQPGGGYGTLDVLFAEVVFSAMLVFVVLGVCRAEVENEWGGTRCGKMCGQHGYRPADGMGFGGLAIGFVYMASAFAIGPVSGCSLNPAVAFGVMVSNFMNVGSGMRYFGLYMLAPILGAVLGSILFYLLRGSVRIPEAVAEKKPAPKKDPQPAMRPETPPAPHEPPRAATQQLIQDRDVQSYHLGKEDRTYAPESSRLSTGRRSQYSEV